MLISGGDGGESGGFLLPGGRRVDLQQDALHTLGLHLLGLLQTTITSQQGQTASLLLPSISAGVEDFYAGVTFDRATATFVDVTPTRSLVIQ